MDYTDFPDEDIADLFDEPTQAVEATIRRAIKAGTLVPDRDDYFSLRAIFAWRDREAQSWKFKQSTLDLYQRLYGPPAPPGQEAYPQALRLAIEVWRRFWKDMPDEGDWPTIGDADDWLAAQHAPGLNLKSVRFRKAILTVARPPEHQASGGRPHGASQTTR